MARVNSIKCDQCGKELTVHSDSPSNYGLSLKAENYSINNSGPKKCIHVYPPIGQERNFCDLECLRWWVEDEGKG